MLNSAQCGAVDRPACITVSSVRSFINTDGGDGHQHHPSTQSFIQFIHADGTARRDYYALYANKLTSAPLGPRNNVVMCPSAQNDFCVHTVAINSAGRHALKLVDDVGSACRHRGGRG